MRLIYVALSLLLTAPSLAQEVKTVALPVGVLSPVEMQRLMPTSVFFKGQSATTQIRNSSGVRRANGGIILAGLVDTGGYSNSVREKYQFYLLSDTSFEIDGEKVGPGAYGCGFIQDGFLVMDLGGNEMFHGKVNHDTAMTRPRPLQMQAGKTSDEFRLYLGRDFVAVR